MSNPNNIMTDEEVLQLAKDTILLAVGMFYGDFEVSLMHELMSQTTGVDEEYLLKKFQVPKALIRPRLKALAEGRMVKRSDQTLAKRQFDRKEQKNSFWYVDYRDTLDCVRYRMFLVSEQLDALKGSEDNSYYECEKCQRRYSKIKSMAYLDMRSGLMLCELCGTELTDPSDARRATQAGQSSAQRRAASSAAEEQVRSFRRQLQPLVDRLERSRGVTLPLSCQVRPLPSADEQRLLVEETQALRGDGEDMDAEEVRREQKKRLQKLYTGGAVEEADDIGVLITDTDHAESQQAKAKPSFLQGDLHAREAAVAALAARETSLASSTTPTSSTTTSTTTATNNSSATTAVLMETGQSGAESTMVDYVRQLEAQVKTQGGTGQGDADDGDDDDDDDDDDMGGFEDVDEDAAAREAEVAAQKEAERELAQKNRVPYGAILVKGAVVMVQDMTDAEIDALAPDEYKAYMLVVKQMGL